LAIIAIDPGAFNSAAAALRGSNENRCDEGSQNETRKVVAHNG